MGKALRLFTLAILLMALISCQKITDSNTDQATGPDNVELSIAQGLDDDLGYMEPVFSVGDSVDALFALSWGRIRMPFFQQSFNFGHASAIAFDQEANPGPYFHLGGLDMGDVTLTTPVDTLQLKPFQGMQNNFVYLSVNNHKNNDNMDGNRFFNFFPFSMIDFEPVSDYTFSTSGSTIFPAVTINLHTPQNLLTINSPSDGQDVSIDNGIVINWTGATGRSKILVAVTIGRRFNFRAGARGNKNDLQNSLRLNFENLPIIIKTFKQNVGSVNITKSELQDLLKDVDSKTLAINVSAIDFEKENINNRMIGKMIRMHDRLFVTIK